MPGPSGAPLQSVPGEGKTRVRFESSRVESSAVGRPVTDRALGKYNSGSVRTNRIERRVVLPLE